ncbi:MAG: tetratricopeptide repeat protein [Chitinophagaceae bacterium]|nr:tetratricopeptide repeat protein [Chitinophagaceae bacterium]
MTYTYNDIENYVSGSMSAEERSAFEQQLQTDEQLQQMLSSYRFTQHTVEKHQQAEQTLPQLQQILTPLTQQYFKQEEQKAKVIPIKRWVYALAAAASVALILFLSIPGVSVDGYPVDAMSGAVTRGNEDELSKAAQLFNDQKYADAVTAFMQLQKNAPDDATINYHLGIALVKTQQYADALPLFETITKGESVYKEDANFFAALSAYHLQQTEKALQYADAVKPGSRYEKYAKALKKKLK